jgi:prepilin-type N-terminal cleavage/methylation domain-containing protein
MIQKKGFTLIEILIVVAIIAILASIVLVGLGPTQQAGRDARRLSDLSEVQNGLELFYQKCGFYPGMVTGGTCASGSPGATWAVLATDLQGAGIGIGTIPSDPSTNRTYAYGYDTGNTTYILAAALENQNNAVFNNYQGVVTTNITGWAQDSAAIAPDHGCPKPPFSASPYTYCKGL